MFLGKKDKRPTGSLTPALPVVDEEFDSALTGRVMGRSGLQTTQVEIAHHTTDLNSNSEIPELGTSMGKLKSTSVSRNQHEQILQEPRSRTATRDLKKPSGGNLPSSSNSDSDYSGDDDGSADDTGRDCYVSSYPLAQAQTKETNSMKTKTNGLQVLEVLPQPINLQASSPNVPVTLGDDDSSPENGQYSSKKKKERRKWTERVLNEQSSVENGKRN